MGLLHARRPPLLKRLIIPGILLATVLALFQWGNRILESTLDAKLPGLLTRELGIQVTIDPVKTWIPKLTVQTPRLVMGDPSNPALVATAVVISLDWSDLLRGEIRLHRGVGSTLMVNPSLWPGNDDPWPTNYSFIEPYLPNYLALDSVRYVTADGSSHTFIKPQWQRQTPAVKLQWQDSWNEQGISLTGVLHSLPDLLQLRRLKIELTADATGKNSDEITAELNLQPNSSSGYQLITTVTVGGMKAQLNTGSDSAWALPAESTTNINSLDLKKLITLVNHFRGNNTEQGVDAWLKTSVPHLDWPVHTGQVSIAEVRWEDEVALDNRIDFKTGPQGIGIPSINSSGPGGALKANANIVSSSNGWKVLAKADITANKSGQGLAADYMESDWLWREGNSTIQGQGDTWGALLNSLTGDIALKLEHRGPAKTPVSITAKLDSHPGELALENLEIKLADGRISGWVKLAGDKQKRLSANINAEQVKADFLIPDANPNAPPGLPVPEFLELMPGVDLDLQLEINELAAGDMLISSANFAVKRSPDKGSLTVHAARVGRGEVDLELTAAIFSDKPSQVTMDATLTRVNFARLFEQSAGFVDSRTSGTIKFNSQGKGLNQIFKAMRGTANLELEFRQDHNWKRAAKPQEQLQLSGDASLEMTQARIIGLQITDLVMDNVVQNLTGSLSMVDGRKPWLEADLTSSRLDLPSLRNFQSQAATTATTETDSNPLQTLKNLGNSRISLKVDALKLQNTTLTNAAAQVSTAPDSVTIEQLDFSLDQGQLTSKGSINWQKDEAAFSLYVKIKGLEIEKLMTELPDREAVPLSGSINLSSAGSTLDKMLASLSGDITLSTPLSTGSAKSSPSDNLAQIEMSASRTADGMRAEIRRFQWAGTNLTGSVQYHETTPPLVEIEIGGGALSISPFEEEATPPTKDKKTEDDTSIIGSTAEAGASMLGSAVTAPMRLIFGPKEAKPGDKLFSSTPMSFDWMNNNHLTLKGKIDTITSNKASASDVQFSGKLSDGDFTMEASAGMVNKGSGSVKLNLNVAEVPATLAFNGSFKDLRGKLIKADIPRSGSFNVTTSGQSQAELAANANGTVYLELGAGPIDYRNLTLLTADVATSAFQTLIPGVEKKQPELDCAVVLAVFKDGIGTTPFGYAARTQDANLIGKVDINLKKELLHLSFSSSNRKGVGLSVGSVFSNTVEIEGPLTDPSVVPNTTGLLWRGWAAVMTGGLSVLGESVFKRVLASDNPCKSVQHHIHKKFCGTPEATGASPMVCPATPDPQ